MNPFIINPLIVPTVNLNGTDQHQLRQGVLGCAAAIDAAIYAMRLATPHGRDYPDDTHFSLWGQNARDAWIERLRVLEEMHKDLWSLAIAIDRQGKRQKYADARAK